MIFPHILNVFIYLFGTSNDVHLKLPFPINDVSKPGPLYYSLLIYQTIGFNLIIILASVSVSSYLTLVQHACCQFSIIRWVFNLKRIQIFIRILLFSFILFFSYRTLCRFKVRQPFQREYKYRQKNWLNDKFQMEFEWIVDIIKRHRRVTELA